MQVSYRFGKTNVRRVNCYLNQNYCTIFIVARIIISLFMMTFIKTLEAKIDIMNLGSITSK